MTLEEMESQAQRALDGMKINVNMLAENQLRLIALVRRMREAGDKKAEDQAKGGFMGDFGAVFDEALQQAMKKKP